MPHQSQQMGWEAVREPLRTSIESPIEGDVLTSKQRPGLDVTLDSLDLREEYQKLESVEQTIDI